MSGAQVSNGGGDGAEAPPLGSEEVEQVARANGWRPREEYKGPPEAWVTADVFVARGFETPAVLRNRNIMLSERLTALERTHRQTTSALEAKVDTAVTALQTVTAMTRTAETRAYERARRELREQAAAAVANADTATFTRVQTELDELDKAKPDPAPVVVTPTATPTAPAPKATPPEAQAFFARNPWYQQDPELQEEADIIHTGLISKRPHLTLEENLAEVERRMKADPRFTARISGRQAPANGTRNGGGNQDDDDDEDDRRSASSPVTPSSGSPRPRRAGRRSFDTMPQEAKNAYDKYKALLEGKGDPFTKEEYATSYWSQFPEDGS